MIMFVYKMTRETGIFKSKYRPLVKQLEDIELQISEIRSKLRQK